MIFPFIQQHLFLIAICLGSLIAFLFLTFQQKVGKVLNNADATFLMNRENAKVIDVRTKEEFLKGHIPNAKNMPLSKFKEEWIQLKNNENVPLIIYCQSGIQAEKALKILKENHFQKLFNLEGGFQSWVAAGYPAQKH